MNDKCKALGKVTAPEIDAIINQWHYAQPPDPKRYRDMNDFEKMVQWPMARKLFEAEAPKHITKLLAYLNQIDDAIGTLPQSIIDDVVDAIKAQEHG